jgi:predicted nucleic acid-binding protein
VLGERIRTVPRLRQRLYRAPDGDDGFHIAELEDQDIRRMAELVETYIDLTLGIVDAAVIAIAERRARS